MTLDTTSVRYRTRNWHEYDKALVSRGEVTLWVDEAAVAGWKETAKSGRRGASRLYSDGAMQVMAGVRALYHLPGRAAEGFLRSLFRLMGVELPVPDHSTLSRRLRRLEIGLGARVPSGPLHLVIDSSGFKVYGEGEWKVRQHGWCKRRTWRKLHLGTDSGSGEVLVATATLRDCGDATPAPDMIRRVPGHLVQVSADGAYDRSKVYNAIRKRKARATIAPRHDAVPWSKRHGPGHTERNRNLKEIEAVGREEWKRQSGYSRRSLAETTFSRLKRRFGDRLHTRHIDNQLTEMLLLVRLLNQMTHLGMPDTVRVEG